MPDTGPARLIDVAFLKDYPLIFAHVSQDRWDDGSPRETSGISVYVKNGMWQGRLRDPNTAKCLWVTAPTFRDWFAVLERALAQPRPEWRDDRQYPGQQAKRPRKAG